MCTSGSEQIWRWFIDWSCKKPLNNQHACSGSGCTHTLQHSCCPLKASVFAGVPANWVRPPEELEDAITAGSHVLIDSAAALIRSLLMVRFVWTRRSYKTSTLRGPEAAPTPPWTHAPLLMKPKARVRKASMSHPANYASSCRCFSAVCHPATEHRSAETAD